MCTALNLKTNDHYFGRNLDLHCSYGEEVCITPRNYPLTFKKVATLYNHYAYIGMATVVQGVPLYYEATNEHGLSMAGLNFPQNAYFFSYTEGKDNVTPFEFIPYILGRCRNIAEARSLLDNVNLVNIPFSDKLPLSPLHWIIADSNSSLVIESMEDGLHIYDNPTGVLTNNPPFNYHLFNLNNYRNLRVENGSNTFSKDLMLDEYCQGLGSYGLPGDLSSTSRFIRMVFNSQNSACESDEISSVNHFFRLLCSVAMTKGCCKVPSGEWDYTVYSCCVNSDKGIYYYTTYDNSRINAVKLHAVDLDAKDIYRYQLLTQPIESQN